MDKPVSASPFAISPTTGAPALPLSLGQILDRVYLLIRLNLRLFMRITTVPALIFMACSAPITVSWITLVSPLQAGQHPAIAQGTGWLLAADLVSILLILGSSALFEAAACYGAVQANAGVRVTAGEAWRFTFMKTRRHLWLAILRGLVATCPMFAVTIVLEGAIWLVEVRISRGESTGVAFTVVGILLLLYIAAAVFALVMSLRLALMYPASIADNLTAWKSVTRSIRLTKGAGMRILLAVFLTYAITYAIWLVVGLVVFTVFAIGLWVIAAFHLHMTPWGYLWIGVLGLIALTSLFFWVAFYLSAFETCAVVIYHDQLLRKEGLAPAPVRLLDSLA